ncbi:hypothetical protein SAMN05216388_100999 [Halorientalis persicus]|uniref:Uncharacterized protein n=2 Tax=Halorientalis persicus TaxID=1367881 RepID=A0A1H8MRC9_9EURY|nr:hypothetical protein SAMN05216388_100999 [Halorientalis persicus]
MLHGYSDAIRDNRKVVIANSKWVERCLTSLVIGVLYMLGGAVLVVLPNHIYVSGLVFAGISGAALLIGKYILREEYLTLEREHPDND